MDKTNSKVKLLKPALLHSQYKAMDCGLKQNSIYLLAVCFVSVCQEHFELLVNNGEMELHAAVAWDGYFCTTWKWFKIHRRCRRPKLTVVFCYIQPPFFVKCSFKPARFESRTRDHTAAAVAVCRSSLQSMTTLLKPSTTAKEMQDHRKT